MGKKEKKFLLRHSWRGERQKKRERERQTEKKIDNKRQALMMERIKNRKTAIPTGIFEDREREKKNDFEREKERGVGEITPR